MRRYLLANIKCGRGGKMKYLKEIRYRLTAEEKSVLSMIAQKENMSQSAFVRHLLHREAKKRGLLSSSPANRVKSGMNIAESGR